MYTSTPQAIQVSQQKHSTPLFKSSSSPPSNGKREGFRVTHLGGGRSRAHVPLREGGRVPAHPHRRVPRAQAHAPVPQAPAARRGAQLRGRQHHPLRLQGNPSPHLAQVREAGELGPDRHGRAGAGVHRAVAADGGAELRRAERRDGLLPGLPAATSAEAERQRQRQRQLEGGPRGRRVVHPQQAGGRGEHGAEGGGGGDAEAVRAAEEGPGEAAGHLRAAPGGGPVPRRRQLHHRRPVAPAQRRPPRLRPALPPPVRVAQERQQVVARYLQPRDVAVRQEPAAPAGRRQQRQERSAVASAGQRGARQEQQQPPAPAAVAVRREH